MEDLQITPTKNTPLVDFFTSGKLIMAGSAFAENAKEFFDPILDWIDELEVETVDFDLILDYINTASAKKLFELLKMLQNSRRINHVKINWFYQKWDEDSLETGKILAESLTEIKFSLVEYEKKAES
ncbi:MAG: DUF1987 domain-containing protein [Bacteroidales bacterium]|nr:DUF1987 domain-containing protein [Bacteroidales bacterium]